MMIWTKNARGRYMEILVDGEMWEVFLELDLRTLKPKTVSRKIHDRAVLVVDIWPEGGKWERYHKFREMRYLLRVQNTSIQCGCHWRSRKIPPQLERRRKNDS